MQRRGFTLVEIVVAVLVFSVAGMSIARVVSETAVLVKREMWETEKLALMQRIGARAMSNVCREPSESGDTTVGVWFVHWKIASDGYLGSVSLIANRGSKENPLGLSRLEYIRWCDR